MALVSHGDNDHVGGMRTVLGAYPEATLLATDSFGLTPRIFRRCDDDVDWVWGGVRFRVLHPGRASPALASSDNDLSCVLSVSTGTASILLPGDIERGVERRLVAAGRADHYDLVIAPHHGSATSSSSAFIAATEARVVVFATGYANRWGFPRDDVKDRWQQAGACLLDTATAGALVFEAAEGDRLRLVSMHRVVGQRLWSEGIAPVGCDASGP